jgi:hypothetical protein
VLMGDGAAIGVAHSALLVEFGEAMLGDDALRQDRIRRALHHQLGPEALVDAAAIVASFNAVVILADGSGIPLETQKSQLTSDLREQLGLERLNNDKGADLGV